MQSKLEVADIIRSTHLSQLKLTIHQEKPLRALSLCRTSALGGHVDGCDECGNITISYNSCRNRHCPKCQGHKRTEWIHKREQDLLPCTYYHVVFTLPEQLNPLTLYNARLVYQSLFEAAWATLNQFGKTQQVQLGMTSVLHTWGQNLSLHTHLHCIVPGGAIDTKGRWQKQTRSDKYLFPVKAMSKVFRAKYVSLLRQNGIIDATLLNSLFSKEWVVYAKRPFGGPKQVIEYLGRYTHKVAISNHRIQNITATHTTFTYKDYKDQGKTKEMTLTNQEFIRRFAMHMLPKRFVRIRHYGILSSSWKRGKLQKLQSRLKVVKPEVKPKTILRKCPSCKTGTLITIEIFGKRGPPCIYIVEKQSAVQA